MFDLKQGILTNWTYKFQGKKIVWTKKFRLFCDDGNPKFNWIPLILINYYAPYWNLKGFIIVLFGREVFFTFGEDINHLYGEE